MAERESFGSQLFQLRNGRGLSQGAVVQRAGLHRGYYSQLENSRRPPPPVETVKRLASALDLEPSETEALLAAARAERYESSHLGKELPPDVARVLKALVQAAEGINNDQLCRIESIINED